MGARGISKVFEESSGDRERAGSGRRAGHRPRGLRDLGRRQVRRPPPPPRRTDDGVDADLRPHEVRRAQPQRQAPPPGLQGRRAAGQPEPAATGPRAQGVSRRQDADPRGDERRGARPGHTSHRTRDQLRAAGDARVVYASRRTHRAHGPLRPRHHAVGCRRPAEVA